MLIVSHAMLGLMENARLDSKCSSSQKIKMKILNIVSISKNGEEREEVILPNERFKKQKINQRSLGMHLHVEGPNLHV